jgi:hypothetical protein
MSSTDSHKRKAGGMKSDTPKTAKNFAYPDKTSGSEMAKKIRSKANRISEEERASLFELGKKLIYGGSKEKVRARH